ncbi:MAG: hypothetical protein NC314_06815 [Roseburia sp.]|nr:hypothetical protein [Roseburia sp.]MCM1242538.1 hypothetical protein [Roseburia sp.]
MKERILAVMELLGRENVRLPDDDKQRMEAVLYAFACKFLKKIELDEIKEALSMTVLGEMIWNDGERKGMEKGVERGSNIKLITQICLKIKKGKAPDQIADELEEKLPLVESICEIAKECAPEYDCEKIYQLLTAQKTDSYVANQEESSKCTS